MKTTAIQVMGEKIHFMAQGWVWRIGESEEEDEIMMTLWKVFKFAKSFSNI